MTPEEILAAAGKRADAVFRAEAGKPLVRAKKEPPLSKGRGPYVRGYSYSIMAFAARCLYLNERLDEANAALVENAQYYLDNLLAICDRDSFHWHAEIVLRLLEMYGPKGTVHAGRITKKTEAKALEYMWVYTRKCSWLGKAEYSKSKTWNVYSSENHHAMDFTCHWHFAKYAKDLPEYGQKTCDDGATLAKHYEAWNAYIIEYCRERARKGLCVEMRSDGYNATLIKGFYNFYDFGDERIRKAAGMFLDMYFAYWAEEQIMGHMGGGASRIKGDNAFTQSRTHGNAVLAWLYFAIGEQPKLNGHDVGALLSSYRPPAVVADIARDTEGRGTYEIRQRVQGLGQQGHTFPHMDRPDQKPNQFRTDGGGILRYSYCTPTFILGTPMTEARPFSDWVMISSQSRWQGVIFAEEGIRTSNPSSPSVATPRQAAERSTSNAESTDETVSSKQEGGLRTSIPSAIQPFRLRQGFGGQANHSTIQPPNHSPTASLATRDSLPATPNDARIVPVPRPKNNLVCFNQFWSVQSKGSLITQKLKMNKDVAEMMVWMSKKGLGVPVVERLPDSPQSQKTKNRTSNPSSPFVATPRQAVQHPTSNNEIEGESVVFIEAPGAYAAIRTVSGTFTLEEKVFGFTKENTKKRTTPPGWVMTPEDEYTPVILEVMAKSDMKSFEAFKKKVRSTRPTMTGSILSYTSIYGDTLTLDTSDKQPPTINGKPVNYAPAKVFDSPFLNAVYDSGIVTISKGKRMLTLDFETLEKIEKNESETR